MEPNAHDGGAPRAGQNGAEITANVSLGADDVRDDICRNLARTG